MARHIVLSLILVTAVLPCSARQSQADGWDTLRFLIGDWVGEGGGQPGQASGGAFSFTSDLQGKVLIRRSYAEYPPSKGQPAYRHDDLMVVHQDPAGKGIGATYFDNEGHVIQYSVTVSQDQRSLTFLSAPAPASPRFRLVYNKVSEDSLSFEFDIAAPGKPDSFSKYIEGKAHRKAAGN
jgi:hypothetical protein